MISQLTSGNFDMAVRNAPGVHVIRFWAEWCHPCRVMQPMFEQAANELNRLVHFAEVNIDESPALANEFGVMSIPTMVVVRDGKPVARTVGALPKSAITQLAMSHLG
ncbi:thioredoxin [Stenotrophomonas sp. ATs4]|uniref:thioredoxin n=1 Tax=Stenotrophomonas sp. ATs4 TaxID=3402766 RepID=UPI003F71CBA1